MPARKTVTNAAKKTAKTGAKKTAKKAAKKTANTAATSGAKPSAKRATSLRAGDHVTWETSQGETQGTIKRKLTSPMEIKGHHVAASPHNPEYLVECDRSGELAAHKPSSLRKRSR